METLESNKLLAIFLGWEISAKPIDPKYPTQEWWISKNPKLETWDCSRCVHLNDEDVDTKRATMIDEMWASLCNTSYGKCGKYTTDWNRIQSVVTEIENLGYNVIIESDFVSIKITSESPKHYEYTVGFRKRNITKLQGLYTLCVEFVRYYNRHLKPF
jgi:hypothetical protein